MSGRAPNRWGLIVSLSIGMTACVNGDAPSEGDESSETTENGGGEFETLIDHAAWTQIDAVDDPLAAHRPATVECGIAGWYVESESLEIDTTFCNYLALGQPSLAPITEGRRIQLGFYYFDLVAPEPAQAHMAVLVDGEVLWEQEIAIPNDARVSNLEFEAPFSAPAGAQLVFHLHNHGQNTWVLQSLSAEQ